MKLKLYKIIQKPPFLIRSSYYLRKSDNPIKSREHSRNAVIIPLMVSQYGGLLNFLKRAPVILKATLISIKQMYISASGTRTNPKLGKKLIDQQTLKEIEQYAKDLGVSKIGYTKVNPDFIFKGFEILYDNTMIFAMEMERDAIKTNPSDEASREIWRTYSTLGIAVNKIAEFVRSKGFNCHPSPAMGGDVMIVPVAQDAGLGAVGKNGILLTPEFGPSLRLAGVFLDIDNLPLKSLKDNEHLWIREFCESCNHCVKSCPANAIYEETKILEDGYPAFIDREKCAPIFSKGCTKCVSVCPFIMGNYDRIKATFEKHKNQETSIDMTEHAVLQNESKSNKPGFIPPVG